MELTKIIQKRVSNMQPEQFKNQVKLAYQKIGTFIKNSNNSQLQARWEEWDKRFNWIYKQSNERPEVAISLVGGTGAGKSTLLNALIGARVLPVSNMRACTAAISEVSYCEGAYRAKVEFVSRESWQKEIDLLLADLRDVKHYDGSGEGDDIGLSISKAALDKLKSVYGTTAGTKDSTFDPFNLVEPDEIKRALDLGESDIESGDLSDFRKRIAPYLDSKHRYWPLVKRMSIQGPFKALRDGAKLIDLPGVNDPNEAREEITRNHLKTCRFVWIVFSIKRALTKDTMALMQSDDFLRQIVMDGRADALTFVGTASDAIDFDSAIDECKLDDDATEAEIIAARNRDTRLVVSDQLNDLAERMARLSREDKVEAKKLAEKLNRSTIITTSSQEYLRLTGLSKARSGPLDNLDQTEIPNLQKHMREICAGFGVEAHLASLHRQVTVLVNEIKRDINAQRTILNNQAEVSEKQRKEMQAAVESARSFLERDLIETKDRLAQDLEANQSLLAERIRRAVDRAQLELEETTIRRWSRTHHGTLRAACRRQGVYVGSTGKTDFAADLCKPILDGIAFAWSEFFGEKIGQVLQKWTERMRRNASEFRFRLLDSLADARCMSSEAMASLTDVLNSTDKILDELLAQTRREVDEKVLEKQRTLYEQVPHQVMANMQAAFEDASQEEGAGMKQRIIEILSAHARRVSKTMFQDAQEILLGGVRGLNNWLLGEFGSMTNAVERNVNIAKHNLTVDLTSVSTQDVKASLSTLSELERLLDDALGNRT